MNYKCLIVGIGNPLFSDDGIGIIVANEIKKLYPDVDIYECYNIELDLIEKIAEYDKIIIIDAIKTGKNVGEVVELTIDDLAKFSLAPYFSHTMNLSTIIDIGEKLNYKLPKIRILGIEVGDIKIGEKLSKRMEASLPYIIEKVTSIGLENDKRSEPVS